MVSPLQLSSSAALLSTPTSYISNKGACKTAVDPFCNAHSTSGILKWALRICTCKIHRGRGWLVNREGSVCYRRFQNIDRTFKFPKSQSNRASVGIQDSHDHALTGQSCFDYTRGNLHNIRLLLSTELVGQRPVEVCCFTCVIPEIDLTRLNCSEFNFIRIFVPRGWRGEQTWMLKPPSLKNPDMIWQNVSSEKPLMKAFDCFGVLFITTQSTGALPIVLKDELEANPSGLVKRRGQAVHLIKITRRSDCHGPEVWLVLDVAKG